MGRHKSPVRSKTVGAVITEEEVRILTERGIRNFSDYIRQLIRADISEHQKDTSVSQRQKDIQVTLLEICEKATPRRNLVKQFYDDNRSIETEDEIRGILRNKYGMQTTSEEIFVAMSCINQLKGGWKHD